MRFALWPSASACSRWRYISVYSWVSPPMAAWRFGGRADPPMEPSAPRRGCAPPRPSSGTGGRCWGTRPARLPREGPVLLVRLALARECFLQLSWVLAMVVSSERLRSRGLLQSTRGRRLVPGRWRPPDERRRPGWQIRRTCGAPGSRSQETRHEARARIRSIPRGGPPADDEAHDDPRLLGKSKK